MKKFGRSLRLIKIQNRFAPTLTFSVALTTCIVATGQAFAATVDTPPTQPGQVATPPSQDELKTQPGVINLPNTVSAPPFTIRDKFDYRVVQAFGLRGYLGAAVGATIGQASGTPYAWGGGVEGFAKRYGSGFAGNLSRQTFAFLIESATAEDPRYFPSQERTFKQRTLNAAKQVVATKTDSNHSSFAYGRVISAFGAGELTSVWQPGNNGGFGNGLKRGTYSLGADFAYNMMQELVPFTRPISLRHRH
jgi:hypothetical protein